MICNYCSSFYNSPQRENIRNTKGKIIRQSRYCPKKDDMKNPDDKQCEMFSITDFFWCETFECWIDLKVCLYKQNNEKNPLNTIKEKGKTKGCFSCNQKKIINDFCLPKPTLIKRKPILLKKRNQSKK